MVNNERIAHSNIVNITEDACKYAAAHGIVGKEALKIAVAEKSKEFVAKGAEG